MNRVCLIYENIGEVVAPSLILVFHFQYVLSHVGVMYLDETGAVGALAAPAVHVSLVLSRVNEVTTEVGAEVGAEVEAGAEAEAIDNTNDVFYAMVTYSDYCSYYYCSFVITDAHVQRYSFG